MKNENKSEIKKPLRFVRWIPFILLVVFIALLLINSMLSDSARDLMTAIVNICMYAFAGISLLAAIVSCVFDIKNIIAEKRGKAILSVLLNVIGILLWIFILFLNSSFSA